MISVTSTSCRIARALLCASALTLATSVFAQQPPLAFAPPATGIRVAQSVEYASSGSTHLAMDVYTPPSPADGRPALVFFNRATGDDRHGRFYDAWARAAASKGIVAVLPDLRQGTEIADFKLLMAYLGAHGSEHGIGAIAVYGGSGNVVNALPAVEDPAMTGVKAAVMFYGTGPVTEFRLDLPILYVRAGLDRPGVNENIAELASAAAAQNAPLTLLNYAGGHHAFEMVDDNAVTRDIVDQTLEFVRRVTRPDYQASLRASLVEATAAGQVQTRKFHDAAASYAQLVSAQPANPRLRLAYGEALLGDTQYAAACAEFDKLRGAGLGYRDLGLPAAEACLKKGDAEAALAWLRSIPPRFRPASLRDSLEFAALRNRPDFLALFADR